MCEIMKLKLLTLTTAFLTLSLSAHARPLEEAEKTSLSNTMNEMTTAIENMDVSGLNAGIPPRIITELAKVQGMSEEELRTRLDASTERTTKLVSFSDAHYTLEGFDLIEATEIDYGFIILDMKVTINNQSQNLSAPVLIVHEHEGDAWYALRAEEGQMPLIKSAYPDLENVQLPKPAAPPKG